MMGIIAASEPGHRGFAEHHQVSVTARGPLAQINHTGQIHRPLSIGAKYTQRGPHRPNLAP